MTNNLHRSVASQIWLNYFNQTLYRRGIIPEAAYHQMLLRIQGHVRGCAQIEFRK